MLNEFIRELKESPFLSRIIDGHNVIMVCMYGSRLLDLTDTISDYDLLVITDDNEEPSYPQEYLTYEGVKVHWYYKPLASIIDSRRKTLSYFGTMQLAFLTDDEIVYENPAFANLIQFVKNNKETIGQINAINLINAKQELISSILAEGTINEHNYTKFLYHLCYTSYYLYGEVPDRDFLIEIKRICELPVRAEYISLAVARLEMLQNYIANSSFDVENAVAMLDSEVQMLLQNM